MQLLTHLVEPSSLIAPRKADKAARLVWTTLPGVWPGVAILLKRQMKPKGHLGRITANEIRTPNAPDDSCHHGRAQATNSALKSRAHRENNSPQFSPKRHRNLAARSHGLTSGSQCLVGGAEGIRTVGLFWAFCSWDSVRNPLVFGRGNVMNHVEENFSERFLLKWPRRNLPRHKPSLNVPSAKRTCSSNPLCSTNESLRTASGSHLTRQCSRGEPYYVVSGEGVSD